MSSPPRTPPRRPHTPAAALVRSPALTPAQRGLYGSRLHHSTPVKPRRSTTPKKGGKRLPRSRRGTTKKRTPKPKWASTRKYRRIHGGNCGCSIPRGI